MKKLACATIVCLAATMMGANLLTPDKQDLVSKAFKELKLEVTRSEIEGGPMRFKVTTEFMDGDKTIQIEAEGTVKISEANKGS